MGEFDYSDEFLEEVSELFQGFAQPTRLKIIRELHDGPRSVSELHEAIGGSQANVSKHLSMLKDRGIVSERREGVSKIYEIARKEVSMICEQVCNYMKDRLEEKLDIGPEE
ncbi:MAG: ArsR/SmtB family transcription factor [bacterium]